MPSLTLTDPDMILPFDSERQSQTPSPPQIAYLSNLNSRTYDNNATPRKKNFSRHAWTHDDVSVSRRLSDIGEELSPARSESFDEGYAEPQTQELDAGSRDNAAYSSSSSTISAGSRRASASKEHSERERGAETPVDEVARAQATAVVGSAPSSLPASSAVASAAAEGKGPGEEFSSAILSSEAERILENAKKRLNVRGCFVLRL
jgi:hypothetical protein